MWGKLVNKIPPPLIRGGKKGFQLCSIRRSSIIEPSTLLSRTSLANDIFRKASGSNSRGRGAQINGILTGRTGAETGHRIRQWNSVQVED
ncbi:MAG: hypothetical protein LBR79_03405 [Oscillospiraceae bacterium]|nr:hypothetical protein [Oscillospiraceae bacterium]